MWKVTLDGDRLVFTPFFGDPAADQDPDQCLAEYQKLRERYAQCEMDLQNRDEELQDLKLENDRLQQRENLYKKYLNMFDCSQEHVLCVRCEFYNPCDSFPCKVMTPSVRHNLVEELKQKLEDIG